MTLRVLEPGLCTLVVDFGRPRYRSLGVPVGGAADRFSLALGNALVGNHPAAAGLEVALAGPTLQADCELACVVYGAPFAVTCEGRSVAAGWTFTLERGEMLRISDTVQGVRAYLCVQGGVQGRLVLGSRSSFQPLEAGAELACQPGRIPGRSVRAPAAWNCESGKLRFVDGLQAGWFDLDDFCCRQFSVTPESNRMGLRLRGEPVRAASPAPTLPQDWAKVGVGVAPGDYDPPHELVSEPVCPGTVQVTNDGQCIVLGMDAQTTGGYPKIAQVISADLDKLGQLRPGDRILFERVDLDQAERLYRQKQAELAEWVMRLQVTMENQAP